METDQITDTHTIFIKTGVATDDQIHDCVVRCLEEISAKIKVPPCDYRINLVKTHESKYLGYCFVWLSDERYYHVIMGNNPDGTRRVELKFEDEPEIIDIKNINWGDEPTGTTIEIPLPSLVTFPGYEYNASQLKYHKELDPDFDGTMGYFFVSAAYTTVYNNERSKNILTCDRPKGIPARDFEKLIREQFKCYSTRIEYPKIKLKTSNSRNRIDEKSQYDHTTYVEIIYHPDTYDAEFALLMMKKFSLNYRGKMVTIMTKQSRRRYY